MNLLELISLLSVGLFFISRIETAASTSDETIIRKEVTDLLEEVISEAVKVGEPIKLEPILSLDITNTSNFDKSGIFENDPIDIKADDEIKNDDTKQDESVSKKGLIKPAQKGVAHTSFLLLFTNLLVVFISFIIIIFIQIYN